MTYPPQPPGGWPEQPPPGQPPQQPNPGSDPFGARANGDEPSGHEQYTFGNGGAGWQQPPPYDQPGAPPSQYPPAGMQPPASGAPMSGSPMSGGPGGFPPPGYPPSGPPAPTKKRTALPFLFAGAGVLVVVLAIVAVVAVVSTGGDENPPAAKGSASASASTSPTPSSSPSGQAGDGVHGDKIVDSATGWQFTMADSPWQNSVAPAAKELQNPVGQSVKLDAGVYATMQLGELSDSFDYSGPKDLKKVKSDLATSILKGYYGHGAKVDPDKEHKDEKLTQYGHKAWLWAFEVIYKSSGGEKTGEYVVIAVLDAGDGTAAGFWGSVPDGHEDLVKQMKHSAGTLTPES